MSRRIVGQKEATHQILIRLFAGGHCLITGAPGLAKTLLVRTLAVYLDSGGNYDRASSALIIHRSTLRYRLSRIRQVSGRDINDPESRLNLHIAIRARTALRDNLR